MLKLQCLASMRTWMQRWSCTVKSPTWIIRFLPGTKMYIYVWQLVIIICFEQTTVSWREAMKHLLAILLLRMIRTGQGVCSWAWTRNPQHCQAWDVEIISFGPSGLGGRDSSPKASTPSHGAGPGFEPTTLSVPTQGTCGIRLKVKGHLIRSNKVRQWWISVASVLRKKNCISVTGIKRFRIRGRFIKFTH